MSAHASTQGRGDDPGNSRQSGSGGSGAHSAGISRGTDPANHAAQSNGRHRTVTGSVTANGRAGAGGHASGADGSATLHGSRIPPATGIQNIARTGKSTRRAAAGLAHSRRSRHQQTRDARRSRYGPSGGGARVPGADRRSMPATSAEAPGNRAPGNQAPATQAASVPAAHTTGPGARGAAQGPAGPVGVWRAGAAGPSGLGTGPAAGSAAGRGAASMAAQPAPPQPVGHLRAKLGLAQPGGVHGAALGSASGRIATRGTGGAIATAAVTAARGRSGAGALPVIVILALAATAALAVAWIRRRRDAGRHCQL